MKKTIKGLIIAASVAAVVGVGAVSFAKWQGNSTKEVSTATSTTGYVSLIGFDNDNPIAKVENLMPWDQGSGTMVANYTLPKVTSGADAYQITVEVNKEEGWTGALYVIVDENATLTPSDPTAEDSDWKLIDGTASVFKFVATGDNEDQLYAHVILASETSADMNKSYDLKFTLDKQSA